jgi:hypothetical protein
MPRKKVTWRQAELRLSYGAEVWVIVRHRRGSFRLPLTASIEQLLWGIADGWTFDNASKGQRAKDPVRPDCRALARLWDNAPDPTIHHLPPEV